MIFVVLGTWKMPFIRPLQQIENLLSRGILNEQVVVQSGNTVFSSDYMEIGDFYHPKKLEDLYREADLIICQAGIGSILLGLKHNKKIIAIARKHVFKEHIDDHQEDILNLFSKQKFILKWEKEEELQAMLILSDKFIPKKYPFREEQISGEIIKFIENI